jgi:acyl-CoA synthetase (AMP-forming)/AMP-acid ligase II
VVKDRAKFSLAELNEYFINYTELARYKRPKIVILVDEITRNILGKIERGKIKKEYLGKLEQGTLFEQQNVFNFD